MERRSHTPKGQVARERILAAAEGLIAAHGFHGTSMRDVASACGVPLASVVYHFARKEALHRAVLGAIADELLGAMAEELELAGAMRALVHWSLQRPERVRLLVRELLDNPARVARAEALPLAPVLGRLVEKIRARGHPDPELAALHAIGAITYVVVARPTIRRIVGTERDRAMMKDYEEKAARLAMSLFEGEERSSDGTSSADRAGATRPRARRGADDGPRRAGARARDRGVR